MAVSDTTSAASASSANAAAAAMGNVTSSADIEQRFLKLLVTQLNNQDPLNPMENAELTSQLAQMSTVSGIEKLNTALSGLVSQSGASQVLQAASMIGYSVLSPGNELTVSKDQADVPFAGELPSSASDVKVVVTDAIPVSASAAWTSMVRVSNTVRTESGEKLKALIVYAAPGNTNDVVVGGAASNGAISMFGSATDTMKVKPGGFLVAAAPTAAGYAITAASA